MRDGRIPPARHAGRSRCSARGSTPARTRSRTTASRSPASSRTRRRPTPIAEPAGPRRRTCSSARWTRLRGSSTWIRSSFVGRTSSRSSRTRWPRGSRSTRATTRRRLDRLLELLDLDAIRADQAARRESGDAKQIGVGFSTYNEMCGLAPSRILGAIRYAVGGWDAATIRFQPLGSVQVVTGTSPHGQSHETTWAQIVADQLGVDVDDVEVLHGDTAVSQQGMDTYGSRSLAVGGIALYHARAEGDREGSQHRRAPARGLRGRPRVRGRHVHGEGLARPDDGHPGGRVRRALRTQPPGRHGAGARGDGGLRPAELLVAGRCPCGRRRGRHGDRRHAPRPLCRGRRRRQLR